MMSLQAHLERCQVCAEAKPSFLIMIISGVELCSRCMQDQISFLTVDHELPSGPGVLMFAG
jgi:hypothetical protein